MARKLAGSWAAMALGVACLAAGQAGAQSVHHGHDHVHDQDRARAEAIYKGHFDDAQVMDRALADWEGDWQSVYPLLRDGTLAPVMARKAEQGDKSAEEYTTYYEAGYRTDVDRILIRDGSVTFFSKDGQATGHYVGDGREVLTYKAGNRGVRYVFRKQSGDAGAPGFIQFSDHGIAPQKSGHYHLYWGDDRAALLQEVSNWPTYYPRALSGAEILAEMLAH